MIILYKLLITRPFQSLSPKMDIVEFNIDELPPPPLSWIMDDTSYNGIIFGGLLPMDIEYKIYWFNNQVPPYDLKHIAMNVKLSLFEECINNEVFLTQVKLYNLNQEWDDNRFNGKYDLYTDILCNGDQGEEQMKIYHEVIVLKNTIERTRYEVKEQIEDYSKKHKIGALSYITKYNNNLPPLRSMIKKYTKVNADNTRKKIYENPNLSDEMDCEFWRFSSRNTEFKSLERHIKRIKRRDEDKYPLGSNYYDQNLEEYKRIYFRRNVFEFNQKKPPREKKYLKKLFELLGCSDVYKPKKSNEINTINLYNELYPNMNRNVEISNQLYTH